jgi:hypothetical protein
MKRIALSILIAVCAACCSAPLRGAEQERKYYLKADVGYSLPMLSALDTELEAQGAGGVDGGWALGVSLGRSFAGKKWAAEVFFNVAYYPEFQYLNEYEEFPGRLSHNGFGAIVKRRFRAEADRFVPVLGLGAGYGISYLISGGGKSKGPEGVALFECEAWTWGNKSLLLTVTYTLGLAEDSFDSPFLENVDTDVVRASDGNPLKDRFSSLDIRLGILIWLTPLGY